MSDAAKNSSFPRSTERQGRERPVSDTAERIFPVLRDEREKNGQCRTPLQTLLQGTKRKERPVADAVEKLFLVLWNEREENGQCRTPKTLLRNERKENSVSDAVEILFLVLWNEKGRERPVSDAVENSSFPVRFQKNSACLNALMNSLLSANDHAKRTTSCRRLNLEQLYACENARKEFYECLDAVGSILGSR